MIQELTESQKRNYQQALLNFNLIEQVDCPEQAEQWMFFWLFITLVPREDIINDKEHFYKTNAFYIAREKSNA